MAAALMHHALEQAAALYGDRDALWAGDQGWSYRRLDELSTAFGGHLADQGVGAGDRVALMTSNRPEFIVAVHAVSKLGGATVLLSPAWKGRETEHALELTRPVHAVADGPATALLGRCMGTDPITDLDHWPVDSALSSSQVGLPAHDGQETDEAVLVFSSGTTGLPKAVRHTHHSMGTATAHWCQTLGLGPDDRFQVATPPSHILGLLNLLAAAAAGATVRLHRRFDLDEVLRRIETDRMTLEMAVAPIALAMANHPHLEDFDLSSLRYIMWGATPVSENVAGAVTRRTGVRWLPAYGASELPVIAVNPVNDPNAWRLDSAGLPPKGVELRVADLDNGQVLPSGQIGEIQVLSPSVMAGYLPEEATADAFADGWYRTGDVGWLEPEGWVHITDRAKEMIKVNGFQVAPAEIEGVLHGHPAVLDCAVFGLPDERAGEVPVAVVQLDPDRPVAPDELRQLVADSLATYKHVHQIVIVDEIARLPSGKVLRRTISEQLTPLLLAKGHGS
ncbi:MAG TPA: AMP-binding protein [Acidimicrobiales bacterium]|jgi:acyl-CoA synthetase (AMP-forming)/AMP-acid ligase II|nr:AMP-binding protein [Acidimicrobiales bacterium]